MKLYPELKHVKSSVMLIFVILMLMGMMTYSGFNPSIIEMQFKDRRPTHTGSGFGSPSMKLQFEDPRYATVPFLDATPAICPAPVPRIVHFTWYGRDRPVFRFYHVISVMSTLRFVRPSRIFFWHDAEPTGAWWRFIRQKINESMTTLVMMQRDPPAKIFDRQIVYYEHQSDVIRLEAMVKYGGIYHDLDVVIVRPLDPLYCYETTLGEELPHWLCNGFMMAVPNATFLRLWYEQYRNFDWFRLNYHSVVIPGILAKSHPELVHIEKDSIHKPNWEHLDKLYKPGDLYDWKSHNYAVHLWYRKYDVDHTPDTIQRLDTTMGHIFRFIYYGKSNMI